MESIPSSMATKMPGPRNSVVPAYLITSPLSGVPTSLCLSN